MKEMNNTKQLQQMISSLYPDNLPGCKDAASENHIKDIWVFSLLAYQNIVGKYIIITQRKRIIS